MVTIILSNRHDNTITICDHHSVDNVICHLNIKCDWLCHFICQPHTSRQCHSHSHSDRDILDHSVSFADNLSNRHHNTIAICDEQCVDNTICHGYIKRECICHVIRQLLIIRQ
ncbi:MAG: hypothetical protein P4L40_08285 [Terracidiphilus sp.]|nr:hypothetical protein [Terracidiphilus sp.]